VKKDERKKKEKKSKARQWAIC